jgi:hypothetical protein
MIADEFEVDGQKFMQVTVQTARQKGKIIERGENLPKVLQANIIEEISSIILR